MGALKKIFLIIAFVWLNLNNSYALSGFWGAVELDIPFNTVASGRTEGVNRLQSFELNIGVNYGMKLGYIVGFAKYHGIKPFVNFNSGYQMIENNLYVIFLGAGLDYIVSFGSNQNPWGVFIGFGYEGIFGSAKNRVDSIQTTFGNSATTSNHGAFMHFGFSKMFIKNLRLEVGVKVPFYSYYNYETNNTVNGIAAPSGSARVAVQAFVNVGFVF